MNIKFKTVIVQIGVVVMMLFTIGGMFLMNTFSFEVARANPGIDAYACAGAFAWHSFLVPDPDHPGDRFPLSAKDPTWECFRDEVGEEPSGNGVGHAGNDPAAGRALHLYRKECIRLDHQSLRYSRSFDDGRHCCLLLLIANLFEQAVHYKEENDLTV